MAARPKKKDPKEAQPPDTKAQAAHVQMNEQLEAVAAIYGDDFTLMGAVRGINATGVLPS